MNSDVERPAGEEPPPEDERERREDGLRGYDKTDADSFPASDPPAQP